MTTKKNRNKYENSPDKQLSYKIRAVQDNLEDISCSLKRFSEPSTMLAIFTQIKERESALDQRNSHAIGNVTYYQYAQMQLKLDESSFDEVNNFKEVMEKIVSLVVNLDGKSLVEEFERFA
ncbi:hypothetical protein RCL_jg7078.t1 [Rhizophagus clarus]|uniref:Uncharacterized protein n=1 Tax=Rhizophagus clarus TaxID=94130 RepID=A0A8H3M621_9GLOM|nr:hypothetical protein RCL_jg7078.t1 [Rhizophagus clarus]